MICKKCKKPGDLLAGWCKLCWAKWAMGSNDRVHPVGCICESCSAAYEREAWDPRMGEK